METHGSISADEAAAALVAARRSRARVAWQGYPTWYWLSTGACLGVFSYAMLLPGLWDLAVAVVVAAVLVIVARAASRARGVCEGWVRSAMTHREAIVLGGPAALVILGDAVASKFVSWSPIVASVLVFVLYAGTGLILGARSARR